MKSISDGAWVTMITPFTEDNKIDYPAVSRLVEWYISKSINGIFAVCQSSEMFFLSFDERLELAAHVLAQASGRVGVVVSGNTADDLDIQIKEAKAFAELNPDAVVFLSNRLKDFYADIDRIISELPPDMPLGIYECPHPFKKVLITDEMKYLMNTGRFAFLKDTCCDIEIMRERAELVKSIGSAHTFGSGFKLFNANAATLYETLRAGYNGYCGVMANFHPDLYAWLCANLTNPKSAAAEKFLGLMSVIETREYPYNAKKYLVDYEGLTLGTTCRTGKSGSYKALGFELDDLRSVTEYVRNQLITLKVERNGLT